MCIDAILRGRIHGFSYTLGVKVARLNLERSAKNFEIPAKKSYVQIRFCLGKHDEIRELQRSFFLFCHFYLLTRQMADQSNKKTTKKSVGAYVILC